MRRILAPIRRLLLAAGLVAACHARAATPLPDPYPDIARAYWVEVDGQPLWAGNADARLPLASLTKLMTAVLVVEHGRLTDEVVVSRTAARETGARLGLKAGERYAAGDLLAAMLVRSANDACRALADAVGGDQAGFVVRMNARAAALGLSHTHFTDACGHDDPAQVSSARDLALLARAALARPAIATAAAKREFVLVSATGRRLPMRSTNALLGGLRGARGLKTGYTPAAGRCLVAVAERDGVEVLAVLLHAPDRWWDSAGLIELAFKTAPTRTPDARTP